MARRESSATPAVDVEERNDETDVEHHPDRGMQGVPTDFTVTIPRSLSPAEQRKADRTGEWPIRVGFPSVEAFHRVIGLRSVPSGGGRGTSTASPPRAPKETRIERRPVALSNKKRDQHPALHALAEFIREVVQDVTTPERGEWLDQHESPLGKRRHLELVRAGCLPGAKRGRQVFVRRADIEAYIAGGSTVPRTPKTKRGDVDHELRALGFSVRDDQE